MCAVEYLLCVAWDVFFFKQKTAYDMRISDWVQTCALPIFCSHCWRGRKEANTGKCQERWRGGEIFGIGHEHAYPFLLGFCYCEAFSQSSTIANAAHYNPDDTHSLCGRSKYARGAGSDRKSTRLNSSH